MTLRQCVDGRHELRAQWTVYLDASTFYDDDGRVWVNDDQRTLADSDGVTEWWCRTCNGEVTDSPEDERVEVEWV